jgi:hypothetical protein
MNHDPAAVGTRYHYEYLLLFLAVAFENRRHNGDIVSIHTGEICRQVFGIQGFATYIQEINGIYLIKLTPNGIVPNSPTEVYIETREDSMFATIVPNPNRVPIV